MYYQYLQIKWDYIKMKKQIFIFCSLGMLLGSVLPAGAMQRATVTPGILNKALQITKQTPSVFVNIARKTWNNKLGKTAIITGSVVGGLGLLSTAAHAAILLNGGININEGLWFKVPMIILAIPSIIFDSCCRGYTVAKPMSKLCKWKIGELEAAIKKQEEGFYIEGKDKFKLDDNKNLPISKIISMAKLLDKLKHWTQSWKKTDSFTAEKHLGPDISTTYSSHQSKFSKAIDNAIDEKLFQSLTIDDLNVPDFEVILNITGILPFVKDELIQNLFTNKKHCDRDEIGSLD